MTRRTAAAVALSVWAMPLAPVSARAQATTSEPQLTPAPQGASDAEVIAHVLTEEIGSWRRAEPVIPQAPARIEALSGQTDALALYGAQLGGHARYRESESGIAADVTLVGFPSYLDGLGFFSALRTGEARRVLLASNAYRQDGVLHAWSGRWYMRVHAEGVKADGLPPDQQLAGELERGLPPVGEDEVPRLVDLLLREWITSVSISYRPTELLGDGQPPMALIVSHDIGLEPVSVQVIDAGDPERARRWYTDILARVIERTGAFAIAGLGEEGFGARLESGWAAGIVQDQYVGYVSGASDRNDAEALARLVGVAIRTTRPLPRVSSGDDVDQNQEGD